MYGTDIWPCKQRSRMDKIMVQKNHILPDLMEEAKKSDPVLSNMPRDDHSLEDLRIEDPDEEIISSEEAPALSQQSSSGMFILQQAPTLSQLSTSGMIISQQAPALSQQTS